jgi:hypothetical protein
METQIIRTVAIVKTSVVVGLHVVVVYAHKLILIIQQTLVVPIVVHAIILVQPACFVVVLHALISKQIVNTVVIAPQHAQVHSCVVVVFVYLTQLPIVVIVE